MELTVVQTWASPWERHTLTAPSGRDSSFSSSTYFLAAGAPGAGGAGGAALTSGVAGANSVFGSLTATGGGYGSYNAVGGNGGSGGGSYAANAAGTGTLGQGNDGGIGYVPNPAGCGGGGGANALATSEIIEIEFWRAPENTKALKELYKYNASGYDYELGTNAKYFARGIELGQETYEDKAPIAVKISEYVNGPPPETTAGLKEDPVGFPNLPAGFEWRKENGLSNILSSKLPIGRGKEWSKGLVPFSFKILNIVFI